MEEKKTKEDKTDSSPAQQPVQSDEYCDACECDPCDCNWGNDQ